MELLHRNIHKWEKSYDEDSLTLVKSTNDLSKHMWEHIDSPNYKHEIDLSKLFLIVNDLKQYNKIEPFEIELEKGNVVKCVVRTEYDKNRDISIVFREGKIVTAWLNDKQDTHNSLNNKNYSEI